MKREIIITGFKEDSPYHFYAQFPFRTKVTKRIDGDYITLQCLENSGHFRLGYRYVLLLRYFNFYELPTGLDLYSLYRERSNRYISLLLNNPQPIKKIGRNDLCSCGSGKKYKKCCISK